MTILGSLIVGVLFLWPSSLLHAQLLDKKVLTLEAADKVVAAAEVEAKKRHATVVIVVVDDGGYPLVLKRLNDTQVASVEVGIGKARTAAIFRRPSREFKEQIKNGRVASLVLPGATPLQGGVPLVVNGKVIGAIGVSGNTPQEDEEIALAGAAAFEAGMKSPPTPVTYLPGKQVDRSLRSKECRWRAAQIIRSTRVIAMNRASPRFILMTRISFTCSKARRRSSPAAGSSMPRPSIPKRSAAENPRAARAAELLRATSSSYPTAHRIGSKKLTVQSSITSSKYVQPTEVS